MRRGGRWGSAAKQPPHRPDTARAPGLRAWVVVPPMLPQTTPPREEIPMTARTWIRSLFARTPRTIRKAPARCRPSLEALEARLAPATITVTSTLDDTNFTPATVTVAQVTAPGATVSLRDAINAANNAGGSNTIVLSKTTY